MESLGALVLTFDEWTPESGMVTAAQKIQRKNIERAYEEEIKVRSSVFSLATLARELSLTRLPPSPPPFRL